MATNPPAGWNEDLEADTGLADVNRSAVNLKKDVTRHLKQHEAVLLLADGEVLLSAYQVDQLETTVSKDLDNLDQKLDDQIKAFDCIQSMEVIKTSDVFQVYMEEKVDALHEYKENISDLKIRIIKTITAHQRAMYLARNNPAQQLQVREAPVRMKIDEHLRPKIILKRDTDLVHFMQWRDQVGDFFSSDGVRQLDLATQAKYFKAVMELDLFAVIKTDQHFADLEVMRKHEYHGKSLLSLIDDYFDLTYPVQRRRSMFFAMRQKSRESVCQFIVRVKAFAQMAGIHDCDQCYEKDLLTVYINGITEAAAQTQCLQLGPKVTLKELEAKMTEYTYVQHFQQGAPQAQVAHVYTASSGESSDEDLTVNTVYGSKRGQSQKKPYKKPSGVSRKWKDGKDYRCVPCSKENKPCHEPYWECKVHKSEVKGITTDCMKQSETIWNPGSFWLRKNPKYIFGDKSTYTSAANLAFYKNKKKD